MVERVGMSTGKILINWPKSSSFPQNYLSLKVGRNKNDRGVIGVMGVVAMKESVLL